MTRTEKRERAALLRRVRDVYAGAAGRVWTEDDFATADDLAKVMPALREMLVIEGREYVFDLHCIDRFDCPETAADHLYRHGVQADGESER